MPQIQVPDITKKPVSDYMRAIELIKNNGFPLALGTELFLRIRDYEQTHKEPVSLSKEFIEKELKMEGQPEESIKQAIRRLQYSYHLLNRFVYLGKNYWASKDFQKENPSVIKKMKRIEQKTGTIYVIRIKGDNRLKVGYTRSKVVDRVNHIFYSNGVPEDLVDIVYETSDEKRTGGFFHDTDVHSELEKMGVERCLNGGRKTEWFVTDIETVKKAIENVRG